MLAVRHDDDDDDLWFRRELFFLEKRLVGVYLFMSDIVFHISSYKSSP